MRAPALEPPARAQALLLLLDHDRPRAGAEALRLLDGTFPPVVPLRRACLQVLGAPGAVRAASRARALELLEASAEHEVEPACRARATWSFASLGHGDPSVQARLLAAFGPTLGLTPPASPAVVERQEQLARALVRAGLSSGGLGSLLDHPGLADPARAALRRGLADPP